MATPLATFDRACAYTTSPAYAIGDVLSDCLAVGTIAASCAVKLLAWWLALGWVTAGVTEAPILLIGAGAGSLAGTVMHHLLPFRMLHDQLLARGLFGVVARAAAFGGQPGARSSRWSSS